MREKKCIVVFIKSPVQGTVKSRLAQDIGEDTARSLYEHFVLDLLRTLTTCGHPLKICHYPPGASGMVSAWLGERYSYMPQQGENLGERMKNAFHMTFSEGYEKVLLIGSDMPDLTCSLMNEAYAFDQYDAVLGPSPDGGYYLIGFRQDTFIPEIFEGIPWSTERVFAETMDRLRQKGCRVRVLPPGRDIDRIEDLHAFYERNKNNSFSESGTMQFIRSNIQKLFGGKKIS